MAAFSQTMDGLPPAPSVAKTMSSIFEIGDGFVNFEGKPEPHLLNPIGIVHDGWARA